MQWPEPRSFDVNLNTGLMEGTGTRYQKRLDDLAGLYADASAFDALASARGKDVVYDVTDHRPSDQPGDLITGVTRMSPGKVGREYFMTRGHIHANIDRPELYFGLKGDGLMSMESPDGETRIVEIHAHTVCYVPPRWIHRSVNTGAEDFVMLFCYPADSGQDYAIIEQAGGMRLRIVDDGQGGWRSEANPAYRERSQADVEALIARGARAEGAAR
ncbi:glucose-6-phosphate isomerase [Caballeronia sp. LP006]|uniref:glucose-6-phosphate isomerase n=1 Tax=Caballeronia sp. LP006 TaxID=3038552 RepID=UPI00285B52B3|nr:glucose-6-phosphate isomerase [Caballeronia sp. LP006]MDR5827699.1 glucose-6-phosphate isomerase [Caballeronia sp. LP006]